MSSENISVIIFLIIAFIGVLSVGVWHLENSDGAISSLLEGRREYKLAVRQQKTDAVEADKQRAHEMTMKPLEIRSRELELQAEMVKQGMVFNPFETTPLR